MLYDDIKDKFQIVYSCQKLKGIDRNIYWKNV